MEIDANEVVTRLSKKIGELELEIILMEIRYEKLLEEMSQDSVNEDGE